MTSIASTTTARQPQIVVAMNEAGLSAYQFGYLDAELGYPFAPEMYFVRQGDMLEYTEGFESVRGESEITRSFKRRHGSLVTDADIECAQAEAEADIERMQEETDEYVEWQMDIEWMRGGC